MKLRIHAALVASIVLSLSPFELGGARSLTSHSHHARSMRTTNVAAKAVTKVTAKAPVKRVVAVKKANKKTKKARVARSNVHIARRALAVAKEMHSVGYCYRGVKGALRPLGVNLSGAAAYQAKGQLLRDKRFDEVSVKDVHDLQPGDILVHGASATHPYGHIAVYLGNKHEASDHVQKVVLNGPYNGTTVFRCDSDTSLSMIN